MLGSMLQKQSAEHGAEKFYDLGVAPTALTSIPAGSELHRRRELALPNPLGALIPVRVENLPACKNIGTTTLPMVLPTTL